MLVRTLMLVSLAGPAFACGGSSTSESSDGVDPSNVATSAAALTAPPGGSTTVPPPAGCATPVVNAAGAAVSASDLQTGTGLEAFTVEACATPDGVHWTGPTATPALGLRVSRVTRAPSSRCEPRAPRASRRDGPRSCARARFARRPARTGRWTANARRAPLAETRATTTATTRAPRPTDAPRTARGAS